MNNFEKANMKIEPHVLCLIIGYTTIPVNRGKHCTTVKIVTEGMILPNGQVATPAVVGRWLVGYNERLEAVFKDSEKDEFYSERRGYALVKEEQLMPIAPYPNQFKIGEK